MAIERINKLRGVKIDSGKKRKRWMETKTRESRRLR
jgi:hypothetical protein